MKLCFSTLGCPEWYWSDILTSAKDLGYSGIEIRGVRNELYVPRVKPFLPENVETTKTQLATLGLTIPCFSSACELHKADKVNDTLFECKEYVDVAADLGVPYVRVLGDTNPAPGTSADIIAVRDSAQILGAYAASKGVTLLIETNGYFADTEKLAKLLQSVNSPGVAALWDIHHPFRYANETPAQTIANIGTYIRHVHIKDSRMENGAVAYKVMGQGDLPVREIVSLLIARGYDGYYSLEWVRRWDMSLEEPGIAFALYAQYMRSL